MDVHDIVKKYLKDNGYDGLVNVELDCGCYIDDLFVCEQVAYNCEPAYAIKCTDDCDEKGMHDACGYKMGCLSVKKVEE